MSLRTKLAVLFTLLYVSGFGVVAAVRLDELICLPLNELGDFLAGAFGPLALAWLVFGYFQQGDELKQGTEALLLQAAELKESVQQQTAMVNVAKLQLEEDIRRSNENKQSIERAADPKFKLELRADGRQLLGGLWNIEFELTNDGSTVHEVEITAALKGQVIPVVELDKILAGSVVKLSIVEFLFENGCQTEVAIKYLKSTGLESSFSFFVKYTVSGMRQYDISKKPFDI